MKNEIETSGARGELPGVGNVGKIDCFTVKRRKLIAGQVCGELRGRALYLRGELVNNFTAFDLSTTPPTIIRRDYSLEELRKLGAKLPKFYFDELGNLRGERDELIMASPGYLEMEN